MCQRAVKHQYNQPATRVFHSVSPVIVDQVAKRTFRSRLATHLAHNEDSDQTGRMTRLI